MTCKALLVYTNFRMTKEERMLKNFVEKYGEKGLKDILKMFTEEKSNQIIADFYDVTRQRVHQWQKAFTVKNISLRPHVNQFLKNLI